MIIRIHTTIIAATAFFAMAGTPPVMAEEVTTVDPLTKIMIETWEPTPQVTLQLMIDANLSTLIENLDQYSLNMGVTSMRWGGCEAIFNTVSNDPLCDWRGPGEEFFGNLWNYVTRGEFITDVDLDVLADMVVTLGGEGRVKFHLEPLTPLIVMKFDPALALDYQRWRENWCNFLFTPGSPYAKPELRASKPTSEECLADPFARYLMDTYCEGAASCELGHLSWGYGFLTRRYMWGGDEAVVEWQQAMATIGRKVGLTLPDPMWAGTAVKSTDK